MKERLETIMANEYKDYADAFIAKYINADGYPPEGDIQRARELANRCALRARQDGLNPDGFEFNLGIPLEEYINDAIIRANDNEVNRKVAKDS